MPSCLRPKSAPFNDKPACMVRPTLIDLNPLELKNYSFMISLGKCSESCNVLSPKICFLKKAKGINEKVFNMITNKNEAKAMPKHISCDCKCKFNSTTCTCNNFESCCKYKKDSSYNRSTCICENSKYLKSIADASVITCNETKSVMDIV